MTTVLAVDAGRTRCLAAAYSDDGTGLTLERSVTRSSVATLIDPDGPARVAGTVAAALGTLGCLGRSEPATVVVAAAGALTRHTPAVQLTEQLAGALAAPRRWGLSTGIDEIVVTSEVAAAHAAAFQGEPGVVLAVGTGAVALALDGAGRHTVVDGGGYLVGDAGSGFAVGRAGLAAALRYEDGRAGGSAALAAAAAARFAPPGGTLRDVVAALHAGTDPGRRVTRVASFAPEVAMAARDGDPVAATIWRDAASQLGDTAVAACHAMPPAEAGAVVLVGALFQMEDLLVAPLRTVITEQYPRARVRVGSEEVVAGAAQLAFGKLTGYDSLLLSRPVRVPPVPVAED